MLSQPYGTHEEALAAIANLANYYETSYPDFYASDKQKVTDAVNELQAMYNTSVFEDQEVDWTTHPNNVGHKETPGCFRCHDGKHLNAENQAVRLECNLCHSIPVVAGAEDFVTDIEISRGPEPESHLNPNWISLHNQVFDQSCSSCHTTDDPGGTSNTSFCSNSACHGNVYTYAGFDAPALREILKEQVPPPPAEAVPAATGNPTFDSYVGPLFASKCTVCHGSSSPQKGLDLSTYASTMKGGEEGPVIIPGDNAGSKLIQVQSGPHFATLAPNELEIVKEWIDAGAPEK